MRGVWVGVCVWGGLEVACPGAKGERCVWVCVWGLEVACPGAKGERCVGGAGGGLSWS